MNILVKLIKKFDKRILAVMVFVILSLEFAFTTYMFDLSIPAGFVFTLTFLVLNVIVWIVFGKGSVKYLV